MSNKKELKKELKKLKEKEKKYQKESWERFKTYFIHSKPMKKLNLKKFY